MFTFGGVFLASLLGSPHCAAMCGGFALICSRGSARHAGSAAYHLGRLLSYMALGGLAGGLGHAVSNAPWLQTLRLSAGVLTGGLLVVLGVWIAVKGSVSVLNVPAGSGAFRIFRPLLKRFEDGKQAPAGVPLLMGICTAFLPCGWLFAQLAVAAGTESAGLGVAVMGVFWAGTVPALASVQAVTEWAHRKWARYLPRGVAILFVAAGIWSLFSHLRMNPGSGHSHHTTHLSFRGAPAPDSRAGQSS